MVEFVLQRPEFLAILDAIQVENVVGLAHGTLFPTDAQQRRAVIEQGIAQLQQQQLLILPNGETPILDRDLFATLSVVAFPDVAVMVVRNIEGAGPQLFLEYVSANLVVEQTLPKEGVHRLVLLGELDILTHRIGEIVPLPATLPTSEHQMRLQLSQDTFFTVDCLIERQQPDEARALLRKESFAVAAIEKFLDSLEHPVFRGNIAMLRCHDGEVVDARNAAIVQDQRVAWFITQQTPGEPQLTISTITASQIASRLSQWYDELSTVR